ncbi:hypothetical protein PMZ80_006214 [Knufia obscura]|uniref:Signal peptidase subunit 3 n=2 Tax=Knufia TaxID=430999 RepID=A0AAN8ELK7_9EURO|nr:hypothetical protein PMZ80_006214 [Knufia obscura]KAK5953637.1 hypothetical protein OHC33_005581 [Knufia fluminis]
MHSSLNRLQTTFGFFTSCAFALAGVIAFLSVIPFPAPTAQPTAKIAPRDIQVVKGRPHYYSNKKEEYAQIRFDLDADLSPLFTWNTKQLFVYVTANYPDTRGGAEQSETVIWDMIIPATATPWSWTNLKSTYFPDKKTLRASKNKSKKGADKDKSSTTALTKPGKINLKNQRPKYQITDPSGIMSEKSNVTLQVGWNVQPWVGALVWDKGYLGSRVGSWKAARNGRSKSFDLPALKGSKTDVVKEPDGPNTPRAGEGKPVIEI